jgi:hypothetical protein
MRRRLALLIAIIAVTLSALPRSIHACQMSCILYGTSSTRGLLTRRSDEDGAFRPIANAKLVIRDASATANGPEAFCGRKGPIMLTTSTDKRGNFRFKGLRKGTYYVTYMDPKDGQSFWVELGRSDATKKRLELPLNDSGGVCYVVDIERNVTIPDVWGVKPVKDDH